MEHWFNLVQFTKREGLGVQKTTSAVWCGSWPSGWNELLDAWQRHSHWLLSHFLGHLCPSDPWTSMVETWNTCHSRTLDVPLMFIEWNITGFNPIAGRLCGHSAVFPGVSTVVWSGFSSHLWWIFWHFFKVSSKSLESLFHWLFYTLSCLSCPALLHIFSLLATWQGMWCSCASQLHRRHRPLPRGHDGHDVMPWRRIAPRKLWLLCNASQDVLSVLLPLISLIYIDIYWFCRS